MLLTSTTRELDAEYSAEFTHCDRRAWYDVTAQFDDANLYQTWSYDRVRYTRSRVVHMVVRRKAALVAAAQARIVHLPGTARGIAYVRWGPLWRSFGRPADPEVFRQAVRALRNELSRRRRLVVRIYPMAYRGRDDELSRILREEGYGSHEAGVTDRTLILDLAPSLAELRATLDQKWRNHLNRAEKGGLELICGDGESLFDEFAEIYREMVARKRFLERSDIAHLKMVQRDLPESLKLRVTLCRFNGELCAGSIFSAIGSTGIHLKGATSNAGLKTSASYLVHWDFVRWLKETGVQHYDLNGINPTTNPGTYSFKRGLAGRHGRDVEFLGRFQVADSRVSACIVKEGERLLAAYRRLGHAAKTLQTRP